MSWFDGDLTYKQMLLTNKFRSGTAMKTSPTKPSILPYQVTIAGVKFTTTATTPEAAISKGAYRYAAMKGLKVEHVQSGIKRGELWVGVTAG